MRGSFLAQMRAVAHGQTHICNRLNLLGEFLSHCASPYILSRWILNLGQWLGWLPPSVLPLIFPSVCHELFPPQTDKQAGLVGTPEGVGSFVLRKFKGKIKEPESFCKYKAQSKKHRHNKHLAMRLYLVTWALSAPHHTVLTVTWKKMQRLKPQVLYQSSELETGFCLPKKPPKM